MTIDDISTTVDEFATGRATPSARWFDGVEPHGANGYLFHQFLADNTNLRTDRYTRGEPDPPRSRSLRRSPTQSGPTAPVSGSRPAARSTTWRRPIPRRSTSPCWSRSLDTTSRTCTWSRSAPRTDQAAEQPGPARRRPQPPPFAGSVPRITRRRLWRRWNPLADAAALATLWLANPDLDARIKAGGPFNTPTQPRSTAATTPATPTTRPSTRPPHSDRTVLVARSSRAEGGQVDARTCRHQHPRPDSLTAATSARHDTLAAAGYTVDLLDLYAEGFDQVLRPDDEPDWHDSGKEYWSRSARTWPGSPPPT